MDIIPLGHASFKLKGKTASVVCDPYDPDKVGLKFPKHTSADIITVSHAHPDHNFTRGVEGSTEGEKPLIFEGPGEYEAKGIEVFGISTFHDSKKGAERGLNTMYRIDIDGLSIVHCGDLGHALTDGQMEEIDTTDVLLIPVGGVYTINAAQAVEVINQLEPSIVIPMHYQVPGLDAKAFATLAPVADFLKQIGQENVTAIAKLSINKDKLPEKMQVVVLE